MPSSADPALTATLDEAADAIIAASAGVVAPIVLIDGLSGSGKSTLARQVTQRLGPHARLIALDDLYPGWDGMDAGLTLATRTLLAPLAAGRAGSWRRWDWAAGIPAEEHTVQPGLPLVIEGCGILNRHTAALSTVSVWLEGPEHTRRARALARDGDTYLPHWDGWAQQERAHIERDRPREHATVAFDVP